MSKTRFLHLLAYLPALAIVSLFFRLFICMLSRVWGQRSMQTYIRRTDENITGLILCTIAVVLWAMYGMKYMNLNNTIPNVDITTTSMYSLNRQPTNLGMKGWNILKTVNNFLKLYGFLDSNKGASQTNFVRYHWLFWLSKFSINQRYESNGIKIWASNPPDTSTPKSRIWENKNNMHGWHNVVGDNPTKQTMGD